MLTKEANGIRKNWVWFLALGILQIVAGMLPRTGYRYAAACSAALSGCGVGEDGPELSDEDRARWREQARQWLRADLTAWGKALQIDPAARDRVRQTLTHWRGNPDLAGLREPAELEKLPVEERDQCLALWKEVDALVDRATGP
jgi:eukaryotic-like serine/threonine-protein kinase